MLDYYRLIQDYTSNIRDAYLISKKLYKNKKIFTNIPLHEYTLNIAKEVLVYDEKTIISAILYNPYEYGLDLKTTNLDKQIRKICMDYYYFNFYNLINNPTITPKKIKELITNSFYKIESIIILFAETIVILNYFDKIKDNSFKERFLLIVENAIVPLASQLGMHNFKEKVQDKLMETKYKKEYIKIKLKLAQEYPEKDTIKYRDLIIDFLRKENIKPYLYSYRYKSPGSVFLKINLTRNIPYSEILDVYAIRLVYLTKKECYNALKIITSYFTLYSRKKNSIRDFIKNPKENGYRSIHINIEINGLPVEIQIRTLEMHNAAEFGVAAHFFYKNVESTENDDKLIEYLKEKNIQNSELMDDNYKDFISVYTKDKAEIILPKKSTLLDFAYFLHTDIGTHFFYAIIDSNPVYNKDYLLKNGINIEIHLSKESTLDEDDDTLVFMKKNKKIIKRLLKAKL